jgi:hypothetical protein
MLPTYQRFNGSSSNKIRSFRASERVLIFLVFISFLIIVLFGFFLLPDLSGSSSGVIQVYNKFKKAGPEIFIPAPPIERNRDGDFDRIRLEQKIKSEFNVDNLIEKPDVLQPPKVPIVPIPVPDHNRNSHSRDDHKKSPSTADSAAADVYNVDGQDQDSLARKRRDKVKEVSCVSHIIN